MNQNGVWQLVAIKAPSNFSEMVNGHFKIRSFYLQRSGFSTYDESHSQKYSAILK